MMRPDISLFYPSENLQIFFQTTPDGTVTLCHACRLNVFTGWVDVDLTGDGAPMLFCSKVLKHDICCVRQWCNKLAPCSCWLCDNPRNAMQ